MRIEQGICIAEQYVKNNKSFVVTVRKFCIRYGRNDGLIEKFRETGSNVNIEAELEC